MKRFLPVAFGLALPLAVIAQASHAQADPGCNIAQAAVGKSLVVSHIAIVRQANGVDIEITTGGKAQARAEHLVAPERISVDIAGASLGDVPSRIRVNDAGLSGIRISQFKTEPLVARVVADLTDRRAY